MNSWIHGRDLAAPGKENCRGLEPLSDDLKFSLTEMSAPSSLLNRNSVGSNTRCIFLFLFQFK